MAPYFASHPLLMAGLTAFAVLFAADVVSGYAISDRLFGTRQR